MFTFLRCLGVYLLLSLAFQVQAVEQKNIFVCIPARDNLPSAKLFVRLWGENATEHGFKNHRPTLMLVHGLNGSGAIFYCVSKILSQYFNIVTPDLRGFGRSDQPNEAYSVQIIVDDLKVLADKLHLKKFNLLAFSDSGIAAMKFALSYPDRLCKLILSDATPQLVASADFPHGILPAEYAAIQELFATNFLAGSEVINDQAFQDAACTNPELGQLINDNLNLMLQASPIAVNGLIGDLGTASTVSSLSSITTPTLIIVGQNDAAFPVPVSEFLYASIPGSILRILPGQPHINLLTSFTCNARLIKQFILNECVSQPSQVICRLCLAIANHP